LNSRKIGLFGIGLAGISMIPLLSFLILMGLYSYMLPDPFAPKAERGVLDLSDWNFGEQDFVNLDGEWSFYPNRLLSPDDLRSLAAPAPDLAYARIPNVWYGGSSPDAASQAKFGTYRLRVTLQEGGGYGIGVSNVLMAHRLYVNGTEIGSGGRPAADEADYEPGTTPYTTFFRTDGRELDIVLQVANFTYPNVGGFEDLHFGLQADMLRMDGIKFGVEIAGLFILLLFSGYHLSIYIFRWKDKAYLYSALYFLTLLVLILLSGDKLVLKLLPQMPFVLSEQLYDLGGFSNYIVLGMFLYHLDRRLLTSRHLVILLAPIVLYITAMLIFPVETYSLVGNLPWYYTAFLLVPFYSYRAIRLFIKRDGQLDRKEIALLVGMLISVALILFFGMFYSLGWMQTDLWRRIAFLAVIIFMNTLLALRLANATERTEQLTERLIRQDQLKDEFLANTSHELKTPLHGILNITSFLLDEKAGSLTDRQRNELTLIQDTSTKLSTLVNDLLDVVRLRHGDLRLQETVLDLRVAAQTAFQVLEFELVGKDVNWDNGIMPGTLAVADENRVRQVLYNLIHNAIKHTKQGWIRTSSQVSDGWVTVWVEDTGIGIPEDQHEAIFGYFEQAESAAANDGYTGMGLGLYISRRLVERMGGRMFVERSAPGQGTKMAFTLLSSGFSDNSAFLETAAAAAGLGTSFRGISGYPMKLDIIDRKREHTVLIVDDEVSNIRILLGLLGDEYNVLTAFSAAEALRKLEEHPRIDLMILDVMMPEMSGIDLCRAVRESHSVIDLPILFATVRDSLHDIELCFRAGGNDFIAKPFDPKTLAARVRTLLSIKSSIDLSLKNEIAFLQAQIKPHFLHNAISSIISFCYTDGEKAAYLLSMLSRYLRMVFERDLQTLHVPLKMELELVQAYVEIEKARFGERLVFRLQADPGLEEEMIPPFVIQPFVENAIRHGVFEKEGQGIVTLSILDGSGYIHFEIADNGVGMADDVLYRLRAGERPDDAGIGMTNVRRRLAAIPGASLTMDSALEHGTKVTVYLPKMGDEGMFE